MANGRLISFQELAAKTAQGKDHIPYSDRAMNTPRGEANFGVRQNLFRRVYHSLRNDTAADRHDLLSRMKSAAIGLMECDRYYRSIADINNPSIEQNIGVLREYAKKRKLWNEREIEYALHSSADLNTLETQAKRLAALKTGEELLHPWTDIHRQHEEMRRDYRQRVMAMPKDAAHNPLIVGVMTYGLYFAAIFYRAAESTGQHPELAIVKMSRQDKGVHAFPEEEEAIRNALCSGRDVVVVDDVAHDFKSFLAIYDHFSKPPSMRFSAALYDTPLPRELNIIERSLFSYLVRNQEKIRFADPLARRSLANILQYDTGIDREERNIKFLPPIIGDIF